jgi:hypothetical protein
VGMIVIGSEWDIVVYVDVVKVIERLNKKKFQSGGI